MFNLPTLEPQEPTHFYRNKDSTIYIAKVGESTEEGMYEVSKEAYEEFKAEHDLMLLNEKKAKVQALKTSGLSDEQIAILRPDFKEFL